LRGEERVFRRILVMAQEPLYYLNQKKGLESGGKRAKGLSGRAHATNGTERIVTVEDLVLGEQTRNGPMKT